MSPLPPRVRTGSTDAEDFRSLMAAQLHRTPWLLLSAAAHALAIVLLWLFLPRAEADRAEAFVAFAAAPEAPVQPPPPLPPPPVELAPRLDEALPVDAATAVAENPFPDVAADVPAPASALDSWQDNPALGLEGGAAGKGGGGGNLYELRRRHPEQPGVGPALQWLAAHQDADGGWDCDQFMKHDAAGVPCDGAGSAVHDVGVTGLALLAFLGDGSTMRSGPRREQVRRAVQWLRAQQEDNGRFGAAAAADFVYDHAIAAYAMCEAYGLSGYRVLRAPAQQGLDYLAAHRNPYGAWRYQPRDGDNDASVTGWCVLALQSGRGFGLLVDDGALRAAMAFFDQCTDSSGRCGYTRAGECSSRRAGDHGRRFPPEKGEALTAVSLFCRYFTGQDPKEQKTMALAADVLAKKPPVWDARDGSIDHYYWYYGTYAMYQAGGAHWRDWSRRLTAAVVDTQRKDGNARGSWDPAGVWGEDGGRVYATAILALTLEAYHRYTRLVR
jgi:hypothetical protein